MSIIGISITKETAFRDSVQPFNNVYYYNNHGTSTPDPSQATAIIDHLVAFEKSIHSTLVTFTYARCWHQTLTEALTTMIQQKSLTGAGSAMTIGNFDKERAYLFRWHAGQDSRGNPVYLRKWYHTCGAFGTAQTAVPQGVMENTTAWTSAVRTACEAKADDITNFTAGGSTWDLCAKSGREHLFASCTMHPYLEHRQLGDQWRGD